MWSSEQISVPLIFLMTGFTVGWGHCIGMCGPVVAALSLHMEKGRAARCHFLYHLGRIATYAFMGAVVGVTGSMTGMASRMMGFQKILYAATGLMLAGVGLVMADVLPVPVRSWAATGGSWFSRWFGRISRRPGSSGYLLAGLLLGFLPCGPVYTALLGAAGAVMAHDAPVIAGLKGMILMTAFGVGTVPSLAMIGQFARMGWVSDRRVFYRLAGMIMAGLGLAFAVQGFRF